MALPSLPRSGASSGEACSGSSTRCPSSRRLLSNPAVSGRLSSIAFLGTKIFCCSSSPPAILIPPRTIIIYDALSLIKLTSLCLEDARIAISISFSFVIIYERNIPNRKMILMELLIEVDSNNQCEIPCYINRR